MTERGCSTPTRPPYSRIVILRFARARSQLRSMSMRIADPDQTPHGVGWREHPSTLLLCQPDETASPEYFKVYAQRATQVIELPTGHSPQLSHPEMVADILERIDRT